MHTQEQILQLEQHVYERRRVLRAELQALAVMDRLYTVARAHNSTYELRSAAASRGGGGGGSSDTNVICDTSQGDSREAAGGSAAAAQTEGSSAEARSAAAQTEASSAAANTEAGLEAGSAAGGSVEGEGSNPPTKRRKGRHQLGSASKHNHKANMRKPTTFKEIIDRGPHDGFLDIDSLSDALRERLNRMTTTWNTTLRSLKVLRISRHLGEGESGRGLFSSACECTHALTIGCSNHACSNPCML